MLVDIARIATGYEDALKYQFLRASSIHIYLRPKKKAHTGPCHIHDPNRHTAYDALHWKRLHRRLKRLDSSIYTSSLERSRASLDLCCLADNPCRRSKKYTRTHSKAERLAHMQGLGRAKRECGETTSSSSRLDHAKPPMKWRC